MVTSSPCWALKVSNTSVRQAAQPESTQDQLLTVITGVSASAAIGASMVRTSSIHRNFFIRKPPI